MLRVCREFQSSCTTACESATQALRVIQSVALHDGDCESCSGTEIANGMKSFTGAAHRSTHVLTIHEYLRLSAIVAVGKDSDDFRKLSVRV
jgi:hypothetical protein